MLTRRAQVVVWVVGVTLGLALAFLATELDLPVTDDVGRRPFVRGSGFVLLVVLATVGLVSLVVAVRDGRARRARRQRPGAPGAGPDPRHRPTL